jgi:hypothetical protein
MRSHGAPGARRSPPLGVTEQAIGAYPGAAIERSLGARASTASLASEAAGLLGDDGPAHVPGERGLASEGAQPQRSGTVQSGRGRGHRDPRTRAMPRPGADALRDLAP